jgi:hypothetical protein
LSRAQVQKAIEIVAADPESTSRISSMLSILGRNAGFTRNMAMALGYGLAKIPFDAALAAGRRGNVPLFAYNRAKAEMKVPLDPNRQGTWGYELQCTEIATKASEAIEKKKSMIEGLTKASLCARSVGYAHAGVQLAMRSGGGTANYVLDWWATLDVENPLVFRYDDFDQDRFMSGIPFQYFHGMP